MSDIVLHNYDLDENCYKVRLALSLFSREVKVVAVNAFPGNEQRNPAYLALNPLGSLPILQDGGLTLWGAEAILVHLAKTQAPDASWLPEGPAFAETMNWVFFAAGPLAVATSARALSLFGAKGDLAAARAEAAAALQILEDHLALRAFRGRDWVAGDGPTIAEVALFPAFGLSRDFGIDHDEYPALRKWARRLRALPGFITMPGIPDYH